MKKKLGIVIFIILFILIILVFAIKFFIKSDSKSKIREKLIVCTKSDDSLTSKVQLYAIDGFVKKAQFDEEYVTNDKQLAQKKKEEYTQLYLTLDWKYGAYKSFVGIEKIPNMRMVAHSVADYSNFDAKKYVEDYPKRKKYFDKDYNIILEQVVNAYEARKAVCKESKDVELFRNLNF